MKSRMQKRAILLVGLLFLGCCVYAQNEIPSSKGLLTGKPKKLLVELKAGQGFLGNMAGEEDGKARVFYGGGLVSYGVVLRTAFLGLGAGVEYVDMLEGSLDFPVIMTLRYYLSKEVGKGFFVGATAGYIFGGAKSMLTVVNTSYGEINGTVNRSMKGPYGEVIAGYCLSGVNLSVSYNYRVIGYETVLYPTGNMVYEVANSSSSRVMHTVMFGVSFMLF